MNNNTFAPMMLSISGQSLTIIGQGLCLVSGIYVGEVFFKSARKTLEYLPQIIRRVNVDTNQEVKATDTAKNVSDYLIHTGWKITKLGGIIVVGITIKAIGSWVESSKVVDFFNRVSY